MKAPEIDAAVERIAGGDRQPLYLVTGEHVLAMKAATRIADALAARGGCRTTVHRQPAELRPILADLLTFSLFDPAKVTLVVDSAAFADRAAAAGLIDEAEAALPVAAGAPLSAAGREAAGRLLQAMRLFGVAAGAGTPEEAVASLPASVLDGGARHRKRSRRKRTKKQKAELARDLAGLLEAARAEELEGWSDSDLAELERAADGGLPEGHALVFAERRVDPAHPLVRRLAKKKATFDVGGLAFDRRGGVGGLDAVVAELTEQTGVGIDRAAAQELARRTLRKPEERGESGVDADSAARFAAEYRKIADTVRDRAGRIDRRAVEEMVADRGDQDVFQLLDAIAEQRPAQAIAQLRRRLDGAADRGGERFRFFALFANFCQQLAAAHGAAVSLDLPSERNFNRFKTRVLPKLTAALPGGRSHPLARMHPFRLFRVYQAAAARRDPASSRTIAALPWEVLRTEVQLKGGSADAETALETLVATVAGGGGARSGGNGGRSWRAGGRSAAGRGQRPARGPSGRGRRGAR